MLMLSTIKTILFLCKHKGCIGNLGAPSFLRETLKFLRNLACSRTSVLDRLAEKVLYPQKKQNVLYSQKTRDGVCIPKRTESVFPKETKTSSELKKKHNMFISLPDKRGDANASNVAVVVFLIALFLAVYILLLPPEDREKLLQEENLTENDSRVDGEGRVVLLRQTPGVLKPLESEKAVHKIDPVHLFLKDEPEISDLATSIRVKKGAFSEEVRKLSFQVESLEDLNRATLFFSVVEGSGSLIILLNGGEIFDEQASGLQSIVLPKDMLQETNSLEFRVSSPGWNIFGGNAYSLRDLKVRENFELTNTKEKRSFVLGGGEKGDGVLSYKIFCNSAGKLSRLRIWLNSREVSNEVLSCRSATRQVELVAADLKEGSNELLLQIDEGDYLFNEMMVEVEAEEGGGVSYKFAVTDDEFAKIDEGEQEVSLQLEFVDRARHRMTIAVGGDEVSLDSEERKVVMDITRLVREGTNVLKLTPLHEVEIVSLKVQLE